MSRAAFARLRRERDDKAEKIARLQHDIDRHIGICASLATENEKLRSVLEEVYLCVKPLLPDGWSDARHVMNLISGALIRTKATPGDGTA